MVPPCDDASDDELQVFDRIQHFPGAERSASFKRPKYKIDKPPMISRRERTFRIVWAQSMAQRCKSDIRLFLTISSHGWSNGMDELDELDEVVDKF
jgi:hypothetical protein